MQTKGPPSGILHTALFRVYIVFVVALKHERSAEVSCSQHFTGVPTVFVLFIYLVMYLFLVYLPAADKSQVLA